MIAGREPWAVEQGDALTLLRTLPDSCVHCAVTSPPYFALRSYLPAGHPDKPREMGLERLHDCERRPVACGACYVCRMTELFREVRRVLHPSGTLWLNIADSYAGGGGGNYSRGTRNTSGQNVTNVRNRQEWLDGAGVKAKDMLMVPAALAMSLRADGWYLRSEITLAKLAPMPESCRDRPTRACEKLYLLAKGHAYFYDQEAERVGLTGEPHSPGWAPGRNSKLLASDRQRADGTSYSQWDEPERVWGTDSDGRNLWDWWSGEGLEEDAGDLPEPFWAWRPEPSRHKHYAAFPSWLPRRAIRLGTSARGVCPHCYAPWRRVVERPFRGDNHPAPEESATVGSRMVLNGRQLKAQHAGSPAAIAGWEPSCRCPAHSPIPALVLDPFAGSGVTGMVAREQGRSFVGFDLSPDYVALARKRIGQQNPLLDHCDRTARKPVAAETPSLFA